MGISSVAVIGAGIAGLAAAQRLQKQGCQVTVFERDDRVGGRIQSFKRNDFVYDVGAFIYLGSYTESIDLMREVGLGDKMDAFPAYGAMPRYGELHFLDLNKPVRSILGSRYLTAGSKLKAVKLFWLLFRNWKHLNYLDASGIAKLDNDTVQSWCQRELNEEIYEYLASLVVRGPWLVNGETASLGQLLWTMKNFFKPYFYGLDGGMATLPNTIAGTLTDLRLACTVQQVVDTGNGVEISCLQDGQGKTERFDACVLATTADQMLELYPQLGGIERTFLESTEYVSSVNSHLALKRRPSNPATYIMCAPSEGGDLCGVIVDHLKAQNRVPQGKGMLTTFCRDEWCKANMDASDDRILDQVLGFLKPYYGDLENEIEEFEIGRWPLVVPMMKKGRFHQIAVYQKARNPKSRVQLAGDLEPIGGVNAALVSGQQAARRLLEA